MRCEVAKNVVKSINHNKAKVRRKLMRKIFSIISLFIICCVVAGFAMIVAEAEESEPAYTSLLREGDTEKVRDVFWKRMSPLMEKLDAGGVVALLAVPDIANDMGKFLDSVLETEQHDIGITIFDEFLKKYGNVKYVSSSARIYRGEIWREKGGYDKAIKDFTDGDCLGCLAWLLATCPDAKYRDGQKAVFYSKKDIEQSEEKAPYQFDTSAAAYAEAGNFPEAIKAQEKAISLLQEKYPNDKETLSKYEKHLASYKEGKPWRLDPPKVEKKQ